MDYTIIGAEVNRGAARSGRQSGGVSISCPTRVLVRDIAHAEGRGSIAAKESGARSDQIHFLAPAPRTRKPIAPPENGRLGAAGPFFDDKYKQP